MAALKAVTIRVTPYNVWHGLWCDEHLLPHCWTADVARITESGVTMAGTMAGCDTDNEDDETT
jgi:hypothetical protein